MWHSRPRLCSLSCPQFLISGFPAVGDLGQEFADVFDFGFSPGMNDAFALPDADYFWSGYLADRDMVGKCVRVNPEFLRRLICRKPFHYWTSIGDRYEIVKHINQVTQETNKVKRALNFVKRASLRCARI